MLSALPDPEVEAVLEANATVLASDYPEFSQDTLRKHIAITRENGFALNPGLIYPDSWGLGVVLRRSDGAIAGALSLAAVESRMQPARRAELLGQLQRHARTIEDSLARLYAPRLGT